MLQDTRKTAGTSSGHTTHENGELMLLCCKPHSEQNDTHGSEENSIC